MEADAADVEVFFEAIGLEEIGEFQSPDIATAFLDFALEVADDAVQVVEADAGLQEFVPVGSENSIAGPNSCAERIICKEGRNPALVGREIQTGARTCEAWRTDEWRHPQHAGARHCNPEPR